MSQVGAVHFIDAASAWSCNWASCGAQDDHLIGSMKLTVVRELVTCTACLAKMSAIKDRQASA